MMGCKRMQECRVPHLNDYLMSSQVYLSTMHPIFEDLKRSLVSISMHALHTEANRPECLRLARYVAKVSLIFTELEMHAAYDELLGGAVVEAMRYVPWQPVCLVCSEWGFHGGSTPCGTSLYQSSVFESSVFASLSHVCTPNTSVPPPQGNSRCWLLWTSWATPSARQMR